MSAEIVQDNLTTLARWATEASSGFLTVRRVDVPGGDRWVSLERADRKPLYVDGETVISGVLAPVWVPSAKRIDRRHRTVMRQLAGAVRRLLVERHRAGDLALPETWALALSNFERRNRIRD